MDAIRLLVRADLRQRRGSLVLLALTTALVAGAVLAAGAGARRTTTVLDRFLVAIDSSDAMLGVHGPAIADDDEAVLRLLAELRALDGVEAARAQSFMPIDAGTRYDFGAVSPYGDRTSTDVPLVIEGRLPHDDDPFEVALNEIAADELGLTVGDTLTADTMADATALRAFEENFPDGFDLDGPHLELEVVGVVREVEDLSPTGSENPSAFTSLAFRDEFADASRFSAMFFLQTDPKRFDLSAADAVLRSGVPVGAEVFSGTIESEFGATQTAFDSIAVGLLLFAAIGLATGTIVVALVILRQLQLGRLDRTAAAALGMPGRELTAASFAPLAGALTVGVALGSVAAYLASAMFPYSVARRAEVAPGLRFDPLVHVGIAALALALLLAVAGALAAHSAVVGQTGQAVTSAHLARLRAFLTPPIADGCSMVLWGAGRRSTVRPWTAVAGAAIGITGVIAISVFDASRTAAVDDSARFGQSWDLQPDVLSSDPMPVVEGLADDQRVDAVGGVFCTTAALESAPTQLCTFYILDGGISPMVLSGRLPTSPSEVGIGRITADRLGLDVGDPVSVTDRAGALIELEVVGTVVNPDVGETPSPGEGAVMSVDGFQRVAGSVWDQPNGALVIDLADGVDVAAAGAELERDHLIDVSAYAHAEPPDDLIQLGRLRPSLIALAAFLGALGVIGLVHYLILSGRRRRSQTAILRSLGFVRVQVCESVAAQAITVAACGVVIGLPAGLVVGRWAWLYAVRDIGMHDTPAVPWFALVVVVGATVVGSALIALVPGWTSTRHRPANDLRAE